MMWQWKVKRRRRLAHAHKRIAEQQQLAQKLDAQAPRVRELAAFAWQQVEQNHLADLFINVAAGGKGK